MTIAPNPLDDTIAYLAALGYDVRQRHDGLHIHGPGLHGRISEDALVTNIEHLRRSNHLLAPTFHVSPFETRLRRTIVEQLGERPAATTIREAADLLLLIAEDLEREAQVLA